MTDYVFGNTHLYPAVCCYFSDSSTLCSCYIGMYKMEALVLTHTLFFKSNYVIIVRSISWFLLIHNMPNVFLCVFNWHFCTKYSSNNHLMSWYAIEIDLSSLLLQHHHSWQCCHAMWGLFWNVGQNSVCINIGNHL